MTKLISNHVLYVNFHRYPSIKDPSPKILNRVATDTYCYIVCCSAHDDEVVWNRRRSGSACVATHVTTHTLTECA